MMLKYSFNLEEEAKVLENAVIKVLEKGYRTLDIMSENMKSVGTKDMAKLIIKEIEGNEN